MRSREASVWRSLVLTALFVCVGAVGCGGGRYSVTGRVLYEDGSPLDEGTVVGEMGEGAAKVMAQGNVQRDGTFQWGTDQPGDGARPGKYRVVVLPRTLGDGEIARGMVPAIDDKFTKYETSGITIEVRESKNVLPIMVTKPKGKRR